MKKVPETFILDEEEIKEAIEEWLSNNEYDGDMIDFEVTLDVEQQIIPNATGKNDTICKNIFSAKATKL